jgi:hypothetical protein
MIIRYAAPLRRAALLPVAWTRGVALCVIKRQKEAEALATMRRRRLDHVACHGRTAGFLSWTRLLVLRLMVRSGRS